MVKFLTVLVLQLLKLLTKFKSNAIEAAFGVNVVNVNTMNYRADRSVKYTKSGLISGKTNAYKKAVVQVQEGETIDFYTNI